MIRKRVAHQNIASVALWIVALLVAISIAAPLPAHIGSPDVFYQGNAGPYHLVVSIRTPQMIPGIAEIQIRSSAPGVKQVKIVPLYIVGEGSKYPPPADVLTPSKDDPQFFSGKLWLMASGSWQVRIEAEGDTGSGTMAVPVPAAARNTLPMKAGLGTLLAGLMVLLVAALVSILGAAKREGQTEPGIEPGPSQKLKARLVMAVTLLIIVGALVGGGVWWKAAAANLSDRMIFQPSELSVSLVRSDLASGSAGEQMILRISDSKWHTRRPETVAAPLMPDHGHLMHLFLIRTPQMDRFYHLHPVADKSGVFLEDLPSTEAGHYKVFTDIVRVSGFPDTLTAEIDIPETRGKPLEGDDSIATAAPIAGSSGAASTARTMSATSEPDTSLISQLSDGTRMVWECEPGVLPANQLLWFKFRVTDANGKPVENLEPYMGMAGHAEFVRADFSVFAHLHPDGSVPMAAVELADATLPGKAVAKTERGTGEYGKEAAGDMPGMSMSAKPSGSEVSFPYGFPKAGLYRIFVQVKHNGRVETGVFDVDVK